MHGQLTRRKLYCQLYLGHVQKRKLLPHALHKLLCQGRPVIGKRLRLFRDDLEQCGLLLRQSPDLLCSTGIALQLLHCRLIFLQKLLCIALIPTLKRCNGIPPGTDLCKTGTIQIQPIQQIRKLGGDILCFNAHCGHPFSQGTHCRIQDSSILKLLLRCLKLLQTRLRLIEQCKGILHALGNLLAVEQNLIFRLQFRILPGSKLQSSDIPHQSAQVLHPLLLVLLRFPQGTQTPCQGLQLPEAVLIICKPAGVTAKSIQNVQMPLRF